MRRAPVFLLAVAAFCVSPVFAQESKSSPEKPTRKDYSFTVPAGAVWLDTGLDLYPGDRVRISGGVLDCGGPSPSEKSHLPMPSAPGGSLLAKLHADGAPILATPDADMPIISLSHLYLGVNAWQCHGKLPAKVHIEEHHAPPKKP